jgi:alpha-L-rhamnosidase
MQLSGADHQKVRRRFLKLAGAGAAGAVFAPIWMVAAQKGRDGRQVSASEAGAIGDGKTLNTEKLQAAVDHLAAQRGGTLVIPAGTFRSGALFLKPGVHLHLEKDAALKGSTDVADYPKRRTRVEGHFEDWLQR